MAHVMFEGRVTCEGHVTNEVDAMRNRLERRGLAIVRSVAFDVAKVCSGPMMLGLPTQMIQEPGICKFARVRKGERFYGPVRLWIGDRDMVLDAMEVSDDCPVLIGQSSLEHLQYVVDMQKHKLVPSPENGGDWILDMF